MIGVHGDDKAADCPKDAIFDPADNPDPALGDFVGGRGRDQQVDESDEADVLQIDAKKQSEAKTVSIAPAIYIHVAGGLKPALQKNPALPAPVIFPMM
jgi:hypothetical protein